MFRKVYAVRLERPAGNGRNKACFLTCMDLSGQQFDVLAKLEALCESGIGTLIREALASFLAVDLGLPIPEPVLVEFPTAFRAGSNNQEYDQALQRGSRFAFGCMKLPAGFRIIAPAAPLEEHLIQSAAEIFVFDTLIANVDRAPVRPNCLTTGELVSIIDHDMAFLMHAILFWKAPWDFGGGESLSAADRHIFWSQVKQRNLNFERLKGALQNISDDRLDEYLAALPDEWMSRGKEIAQEIASYIKRLRENADEAFAEVQRVLK
ncbi:HipA family kinase [Pseudomonas sp. MAHUQ-62]|uniref:HipA family kinase n=1 Tax=Pseudomonas sp. GCM10023245 TaxID=3252652 RepID=UPI00360E698D